MPAQSSAPAQQSSGIQTPRRKAKPWRSSMRIVGLLAATPIEPRTRPPRWDPRSHRSNLLLRATQCAQLSRAVSRNRRLHQRSASRSPGEATARRHLPTRSTCLQEPLGRTYTPLFFCSVIHRVDAESHGRTHKYSTRCQTIIARGRPAVCLRIMLAVTSSRWDVWSAASVPLCNRRFVHIADATNGREASRAGLGMRRHRGVQASPAKSTQTGQRDGIRHPVRIHLVIPDSPNASKAYDELCRGNNRTRRNFCTRRRFGLTGVTFVGSYSAMQMKSLPGTRDCSLWTVIVLRHLGFRGLTIRCRPRQRRHIRIASREAPQESCPNADKSPRGMPSMYAQSANAAGVPFVQGFPSRLAAATASGGFFMGSEEEPDGARFCIVRYVSPLVNDGPLGRRKATKTLRNHQSAVVSRWSKTVASFTRS
ncbi:hypothetical protein C8034_v004981 [Colletotrichum sidae]|uniref:Uncharacterized protein n=1 Tax=Colletotrichum sidae TaxID=1347389 RepID=A0A4R8T7I8_9PEZI|nr:hypothetical protein C8034_v004981 [Colletotrichum sidae]